MKMETKRRKQINNTCNPKLTNENPKTKLKKNGPKLLHPKKLPP